MSKIHEKRENLAIALTDIAERKISENGIDAVKARNLAAEAGCAVGAIYNVFGDLNDLIMQVNSRTFRRLGMHVTATLHDHDPDDPTQDLILMSLGYLRFALENTHTWRALFDLEMSTEKQAPTWYLNELEKLFALISRPLRLIFPDMSDKEVELMTRALFSSVHGIVLLGLEKRISAVPVDELEHMIALVLRNIASK